MKWRSRAWSTLKGGALPATGLLIVWAELLLWAVWDRTPSDVLTALALAMLFPAAREHVKTVMSGGPGSSSPSSPPPSSRQPPPSPSPEGVAGERGQQGA